MRNVRLALRVGIIIPAARLNVSVFLMAVRFMRITLDTRFGTKESNSRVSSIVAWKKRLLELDTWYLARAGLTRLTHLTN